MPGKGENASEFDQKLVRLGEDHNVCIHQICNQSCEWFVWKCAETTFSVTNGQPAGRTNGQAQSYSSPPTLLWGQKSESCYDANLVITGTSDNKDSIKLTLSSMVSCQKGPNRHAYAWQIGPFWQDTLELWVIRQDNILYTSLV